MAHLGLGVIDVLDREVEFVQVAIRHPTELRPAIGENPEHRHARRFEERQRPVVQQVRGRHGGLVLVELGERDLGVGVDERLLVDPAHALQRAHEERVLRPAIAQGLVKRVTNAGTFRLKHKLLLIANALQQYHIGLDETDDGIWSISVGTVLPAKVDERATVIRD